MSRHRKPRARLGNIIKAYNNVDRLGNIVPGYHAIDSRGKMVAAPPLVIDLPEIIQKVPIE